MAIIRCVKGHYYDTAKYEECPTCRNLEKRTARFLRELGPGQPGEADNSMDEEVTRPLLNYGGQTVSIGGKGPSVNGGGIDDDPVTVALFSRSAGTGVVTGWLVCVEGPLKGKDFRIRHGMNQVGTSMDSDICLGGAEKVSLKKHCCFVYDEKSNRFFLVNAGGSLVYLNREQVAVPQQIKLGDQISIGNCTFEFVPFCRDGHFWKSSQDGQEVENRKVEWVVSEKTI